jgi:hypothetical protein
MKTFSDEPSEGFVEKEPFFLGEMPKFPHGGHKLLAASVLKLYNKKTNAEFLGFQTQRLTGNRRAKRFSRADGKSRKEFIAAIRGSDKKI